MQSIPLDALPVAGVVDRQRTPHGIVFRRSPLALQHQLDSGLATLVTMSAGVRIELMTTARAIELDVLTTDLAVPGVRSFPAWFDLVVGGLLQASATAVGGNQRVVNTQTLETQLVDGSPTTIAFTGLPGDQTVRVEVWFPHRSVVEIRDVRISSGASFTAVRRRRWAHYGSSISHCLEVDHPTQTWPAIVSQIADVDLVNLGVAGQCMLDSHMAQTIRDLTADWYTIKVGVNIVEQQAMTERTFVPVLHGFLDTIRDKNPLTPIMLVSPIACPRFDAHPASAGGLTMTGVRTLVADVVANRQANGDDHLHFLDGLKLLGPDENHLLPDGLHPNIEGYQQIGQRFSALVFGANSDFDVNLQID